MVVCHQIEMELVRLLARLPFRLLTRLPFKLLARLPFRLLCRLPVWLLARCKAVINHKQYREMVVGFPNPLAPGIQMHVSWGTRLGDGIMVKEKCNRFNRVKLYVNIDKGFGPFGQNLQIFI